MKSILISVLLLLGIYASVAGENTGQLGNKAISWHWCLVDGKFKPVQMDDKLNGSTLKFTGECFQLVLGDGAVVKASDFRLESPPEVEQLNPDLN
jgi:hypothetical protein